MKWLEKLTSSERKLLQYGMVIITISLSWVLVYKPITNNLERQKNELQVLQQQYSEMQSSQKLLQNGSKNNFGSVNKTARDLNKPFISWIDEELIKHNLAIYVSRSEPKDSQTLILTFESVVFDDLIQWLQGLENNNQIKISEADINVIDRSNGLSYVRITLVEKT